MREDWKESAACQEIPLEEAMVIFFPPKGDMAGVRAARAICNNCIVLEDCKEYVQESPHIRDGIIAGMTPKTRHKWLRANDA